MERFRGSYIIGPFAMALLAIAICGCRTQSSAMSNPFLAPDRVPPPSTRAIAPGTAQPYYPGDPLPAIQGAVPAPMGAPVAKTQAEMAPVMGSAPPAPPVAFNNERSIAIPGDSEDLRFALPAPPPPQLPAPQPEPTPTLAATQPPPAPAPTQPNFVSQASYNEADAYQVSPAIAEEPAATSMWRSPQVGQNSGPVQASANVPAPMPQVAAPQPALQPVPQMAEIANPMPVQLRAVTPPPNQQVMQPTYNPPPRMRFPDFFGWGQPQPQPAMAAAPPPVAVPTQTTPTSSDGFRPRGSMR